MEAVGVMTQMRVALETCVDISEPGWVTNWDLRVSSIGGESFVAGSRAETVDGSPGSGGHLVVAVRVGNAIYVSYANADGTAAPDSSYALQLEAEANDFAPNMCAFTMAGC